MPLAGPTAVGANVSWTMQLPGPAKLAHVPNANEKGGLRPLPDASWTL